MQNETLLTISEPMPTIRPQDKVGTTILRMAGSGLKSARVIIKVLPGASETMFPAPDILSIPGFTLSHQLPQTSVLIGDLDLQYLGEVAFMGAVVSIGSSYL